MTWGLSAGLFVGVFFATYCATHVVLRRLIKHALLDLPNERSSHTTPTPRGGGLAIMAVCIPALLLMPLLVPAEPNRPVILLILIVGLAIISWIDDLRGLSPLIRFAGHIVSVGIALSLGLIDKPVFGGFLPPLLDKFAAGLIWVWFINLFNFMDGIDGIAAVEAIAIGLGIGIVAGNDGFEGFAGLILAGAAAGFLVLNWHPARIFLGDVGSVPIGFALGWLLLALSAQGYWAPALILPAYYLADATITLLRRLLRGEKIWQAHREHFYQYAVQNGKSHADVSRAVAIANTVLVGLAILATRGNEVWAVVGAYGVVTFLIFWMVRQVPSSSTPGKQE